MFLFALRDRTGIILALRFHVAWAISFYPLVYIEYISVKIVLAAALIGLSVAISIKVISLQDTLQFSAVRFKGVAFPRAPQTLRFLLTIDIIVLLLFGVLISGIIAQSGPNTEFGSDEHLIFFGYFVSYSFLFQLIHHAILAIHIYLGNENDIL